MRRSISETEVGTHLVRFRTRIEDDPSQPNSWIARNNLMNLFQTILAAPDMMNCGLNPPQKISITHNGSCWVFEAESTIETEG